MASSGVRRLAMNSGKGGNLKMVKKIMVKKDLPLPRPERGRITKTYRVKK